MKKTETFLIGAGLIAALIAVGTIMWKHDYNKQTVPEFTSRQPTKYGAFLAAQHAIYVNDFERAVDFSKYFGDVEYPTVQSSRYMSEFLSGQMPNDAQFLESEKSMPARLIYDAYLLNNNKWDEMYRRHKTDESALSAPLRIWSSVATKRVNDALKFVDALPTNASYKAFVRGQIYAETDDKEKAAAEFAKVRAEFMNINDYLYIMSFYNHNDMQDAANALRSDFTSRPGGMFMLDFDTIPDWSVYSGYKNALAFSLIQNVSHTQIMMYSDLSILLLRFSQIISSDTNNDANAINYYLGQFFFNNTGDYAQYFNKISRTSPFYSFAVLRMADKSGDITELERVADSNPLFVPAINKIVSYYTKVGDKRAALRRINRALDNKRLPENGRAFFLKGRAQIHFAFGDLDAAQSDLHEASKILIADADILALQAKIWASENREIENAYDYAMTLVRQNPTDIMAWDTLGRVVAQREGAEAALDLLSRVGDVADTCSSLFEHLGDLYTQIGDTKLAQDAYKRAIYLSDDGLVVVPNIDKKLRNLK
ncbi:MAG: tetratricopeptide repeat protein [Candidatus Enterousia sp.]